MSGCLTPRKGAERPCDRSLVPDRPIERTHYRAPSEDGGVLVEPAWHAVDELVAANGALRAGHDVEIGGKRLQQLSLEGRAELLAAAYEHTRAYGEAAPADPSTPLIMSGHQPQLFHPGVWVKNFALDAMARRVAGACVNLVIDGDTLKGASLRVPTGTLESPLAVSTPFDEPGEESPYEERLIRDDATFRSFGGRASALVRSFVDEPLVDEFWPLALERSTHTRNLGQCLAEARHLQEARWGARTLECTQSRMCGTRAFRWFAVAIMARAGEFRQVYNAAVDEYRRVNRVRSEHHPAPRLAVEGEWCETPFWCWKTDSPRRRRLFARQAGEELILFDERAEIARLRVADGSSLDDAVDGLADLESRGVKIRSRALTTTLFSRLVLADLFVHGIGGAKYDQIADAIKRRFFGVEPAAMMVLSATFRLPIDRPTGAIDDLHAIQRELRALEFQPERFVEAAAAVGSLRERLNDKARLLEEPPSRETSKAWTRAVRAANDGLRPFVLERRERLTESLDQARRRVRAEAVLGSREYAFILHSEKTLREFMLAIRACAS